MCAGKFLRERERAVLGIAVVVVVRPASRPASLPASQPACRPAYLPACQAGGRARVRPGSCRLLSGDSKQAAAFIRALRACVRSSPAWRKGKDRSTHCVPRTRALLSAGRCTAGAAGGAAAAKKIKSHHNTAL